MKKLCCVLWVGLALIGSASNSFGEQPSPLAESLPKPSIGFVFTPPQPGLSGETPRAIVTAPLSTSTPPSLEERRLSYGLLERKLAQQFPNSRVYLIAMTPTAPGRDRSKGKVVVRGQCPTHDEAASILKILQAKIVEVEGFRWQTLAQHEGVDASDGQVLNQMMGPTPTEQAAASIISELNVVSAEAANVVEVPPVEVPPRATIQLPLSSHQPLFSTFISPIFPPLQSNPSIGDCYLSMPIARPLAMNVGPIPQGPPSLADADPFQFHLRSSEEYLRQAGLTDAANQLQAMHQSYLAQHEGALFIARKEAELKSLQAEIARLKQSAHSNVVQVSLRIRLVEVRNDAKAMESFQTLFSVPSKAASTTGHAAVIGSIGGVFESSEIHSLLDHLCKTGGAKIVSEPQITVLNGREAQFLSGGEFSVPTVVGVGRTNGVSYRQFGTSIEVCPLVAEERIRLSVKAEYTRLEDAVKQASNQPAHSRRVTTTVEMRPGQTLVLAGFKTPQSRPTPASQSEGKVTEVGSLVDDLAKSTSDDAELLIFITPEVVQPIEPREVPPVPGFEMLRPTGLPPAPVPSRE